MNALHDHTVLILGLGLSGLSMARWCARHGARVTVADTRSAPPQLARLQAEWPSVRFVAGPFDGSLLAQDTWTLVARSPGLFPAQLAAVRAWTQAHGVPLLGELDLFAQALADLAQRTHPLAYTPKVLAITGTNGKTTVTSLTTALLQRAGLNVAMAGNIGPALLDVLSQALDAEAVAEAAETAQVHAAEASVTAALHAETAEAVEAAETAEMPAMAPSPEAAASTDATPSLEAADATDNQDPADAPLRHTPPPPPAPQPPHLPSVWVLELSSFQLDGVAGGAWDRVPTAATVLNITEDHLDWHGSMAAYAQAKAQIFGTQALMLLNRDDPQVMAMQPANVSVKVGTRKRQQPERPYATFGLDAPTRVGDWGIETVNGMDWLVRALALDETRARSRATDAQADAVYPQRMMPVDALRIRGRHNAANALAALALATSTGAALGAMLHGLREYRGEPHRVQTVGLLDGVEYVDDSKGTNVGATLAAINGLGIDRRLVVILGGDGKGQDFQPLCAALLRHARAVVLIGRDAPLLRTTLAPALAQQPLLDAASLPEAVALAAQQAQPGDAVLMSPACASMDMFDNYVHRARVFVAAVAALAAERGTDLELGA